MREKECPWMLIPIDASVKIRAMFFDGLSLDMLRALLSQPERLYSRILYAPPCMRPSEAKMLWLKQPAVAANMASLQRLERIV